MLYIKLVVKAILYKPLFNALILLVWLIPSHSVGWAIIILTIIVRLVLLPSSMKATTNQKRMADLQPKIKELQAKYKNDKSAQSKALMAFYKENKINPLGSCLPLLIQFPILIILYYVFIHGLDTSRFDLLYSWAPRPSTINTIFFGINLSNPERWILPVVAGGLQFVQSWRMRPLTKSQDSGMQNALQSQMTFLMPVITILIAGRLPAALPLYWIVTTLFAVVQQWFVFRKKGPLPAVVGQPEEPIAVKKGNVLVTVRKKKQE